MLAVVTLIETSWSEKLSIVVLAVRTDETLWPSKLEEKISTLLVCTKMLLKLQSVHFTDIHG